MSARPDFTLPCSSDALLTITPRERQVLTLYISLFNDKQVARRLGTRPQTVRNQIASIIRKMKVSNRIELIALMSSLDSDRLLPLNSHKPSRHS